MYFEREWITIELLVEVLHSREVDSRSYSEEMLDIIMARFIVPQGVISNNYPAG